jgi:hypothetical protein
MKRRSQKPQAETTRDDFDGAWKEVIERYLREFMDYFFPAASAGIDWTRPVRFLDKELQKITPRSRVRKGSVDKLFEAYTTAGEACLIAVHLEVQNEPIENLEERVFEYHYRIYERLKRPVASLVLLTDTRKSWRPHKFERVTLGCKLLLDFPVAKLIDFDTEEMAQHPNPFSFITRAHRRAQASQRKPQKRYDLRMALEAELVETIKLIEGETERAAAFEYWEGIIKFIELVMRLPEDLEIKFEDDFSVRYGEETMEFMTYRERKGFITALLNVLVTRFGEIPHPVQEVVGRVSDEGLLNQLLKAATTCNSLAEFERLLPNE